MEFLIGLMLGMFIMYKLSGCHIDFSFEWNPDKEDDDE